MKISVIVPTYNRPQALKLCLMSLSLQSVLPDEVVIADDGSSEETARMVRFLSDSFGKTFHVKHVWHEDMGFRKPRILNEAVRQSSGDYLIFIDGDCMAHRDFIKAHQDNSRFDAILSGRRVEIGEALTKKILDKGTVVNSLTDIRLILDGVRGRSRRIEEGVPLRSSWLRRLFHRDKITDDGVWGCNFSLHKDLFYEINGCDEDFLDGSIEDNDLGIRVLNRGGKVVSLRGLAIIFHLWHKSTWGFSNDKYLHNLAILKRRIANRETACRNGIRRPGV